MGWGNSGDHRTHVDVPLKVDMKSVSDGICFTQQIDVALISSHRNFCADGNNAGPCKGDSGMNDRVSKVYRILAKYKS